MAVVCHNNINFNMLNECVDDKCVRDSRVMSMAEEWIPKWKMREF